MKTYLITGGAGFIGSHLVKKLLSENFKVISIFSLFNIGMVSLLLFLKAGKKAGFIFLGLLFPIVTFVAGFNINKINKMTDARNYDSNYIYIEKK